MTSVSGWKRKWSRLTQMDWSELSTRASQELFKRFDVIRHSAGIGPLLPSIGVHKAPPPKFFFDEAGDAAQRALLIRNYLPKQAEKIVLEAENICRHQFHLLGYERLQYGTEIDWHADPVHKKRSPLKPWFKIDFLNSGKIGDHKIIWELNRHQHLVTLAKARLLTNNASYTQELVTQWHSWYKANPYPLGINWASSLEVGFRSLSWLWVLFLLAECPELADSFKQDVLFALSLSGRHIEKYLSTYFSPNTHLLGEATALFFIGTLCPEISSARRWQTRSWQILLTESERQVRPDGVYFEQSLYYHVYALDFFLHARRLAYTNGIPIPHQFEETLKKLLDVVQALSESGIPEGFGDDDGGRVFNPRRNRVEHMTDPLALGAVTYHRDRYSTVGLTEEAIWLFGEKAVERLAARSTRPQLTESVALTSGGIYLMNDPHPEPQQLMIDAGPQGTARSGHGHADALSVRFSLRGRRLLIDPGTCNYASEEERNLFRGTGAHNTLRVDNVDQAIPAGLFAWESIPQTTTDCWLNGRTFDFFSGTHDGYCRQPEPVLHRRSVFHVKGGLWLIHDSVEGEGSHLLEIFWHFAADVTVTQEPGAILLKPECRDEIFKSGGLAVLRDVRSQWVTEIMQGSVSPAYGSIQPAPILRISTESLLPQECGIVFAPLSAGILGTLTTRTSNGITAYRYQAPQTTEFVFLAPRDVSSWISGKWSSNARLLYCRLEGNRLAHIIMIAGSFAEWQGQRFLLHSTQTRSFEWLKSGLAEDSSLVDNSAESPVVFELDFSDATL